MNEEKYINISFDEFMPFHTDLAEDLFEYGLPHELTFKLDGDVYVSEKISLDDVYKFCKEKYGWKNDKHSYYRFAGEKKELKPDTMYFSFDRESFIIPTKVITNSNEKICCFAVSSVPYKVVINHKPEKIHNWKVLTATKLDFVNKLKECNISQHVILLSLDFIGNHTEYYSILINKINELHNDINDEWIKKELMNIGSEIK